MALEKYTNEFEIRLTIRPSHPMESGELHHFCSRMEEQISQMVNVSEAEWTDVLVSEQGFDWTAFREIAKVYAAAERENNGA